MLGGDISNHSEFTVGWDFRLFINVKYPRIWEYFIVRRMYKLAGFFFVWDQQMIDSYNMSHANGKVIVTHVALQKLFQNFGFDTIHLSSYHQINELSVQQIFTNDIVWTTTSEKCQYLEKPPARIHSKKVVDKILYMVDRYLVDKG